MKKSDPITKVEGYIYKFFIEITPKRIFSVPTRKVGGEIFEKVLEKYR